VQDLNIGLLADKPRRNGAVVEFVREFGRARKLYIGNCLHGFENLEFYGTLNEDLPIPTDLLKFMHPILMSNPENMVPSILEHHIKTCPITAGEKELVIKCTENLHEVILRDLTTQSGVHIGHKFYMTDMIKVVRGVTKIIENLSTTQRISLQSILRYWVYLVSKVYEPKISTNNKRILFYLINNILMEEQRVRYKTICPNSDFYIVGLKQGSSDSKVTYEAYTMEKLRERLYSLSTKFDSKHRYLSIFLEDKSNEVIKLIEKFLNGFDFGSKIIIMFN
jgi:hypothetical protein